MCMAQDTHAFDAIETATEILGLIEKARDEGINRDEYETLMQKGLTPEQKRVASVREGEGRIRLTGQRPQTNDGGVTIPSTLEQLSEGKRCHGS